MSTSLPQHYQELKKNFYKSLLDLSTDEGINASGRNEVYGCIFGRDSAITILKMLRVHSTQSSPELLEIAKKGLLTLVSLQGSEFNIESGEEPGKFIHEFRKDKYERLLQLDPPWYIYPNGMLKNYDSIDSTPLTLIALFKYYQITQDKKFLLSILSAVELGLNWIITFGDKDKDLFIEYELPKERKSGGLVVQSWTDSHESLLQADGKMPKYPIAPIEAQAYAWLALKLWGEFYLSIHPEFGKKLLSQSIALKEKFNRDFLIKDKNLVFGIQALDGDKNPIKTITANPLLCLWSSTRGECILSEDLIGDFVERAFEEDLFVSDAGIRTMSSQSPTFNAKQDSYHNGSFWPMLNGLIVEGLENFGFNKNANLLREATLLPLAYFGSPIELYIKEGNEYLEYKNADGQVSCREQAWSAAAGLDCLTT